MESMAYEPVAMETDLEEEVNTANRRIAENQVESAIWESLKI